MKKIRSFSLKLLIVWFLAGCGGDEPEEEVFATEAKYKLMLFNLAGHSPRCGGPLTVRFEFTSDKETRILEQGPDTYQSFAMAIDTGTLLNVMAFNVANDDLLAQGGLVFYPFGKNELGDELVPTVTLCPHDQISFTNFR